MSNMLLQLTIIYFSKYLNLSNNDIRSMDIKK